ncbi:CLUMA_CG004328, isoform A [Clunio marinus]|uniref:CLUMA_CG004328, isoform A n=1 Tax=Clunio marinus TaxID=568069 RepID=A0A1J1HSV3_9DIPT|nr:CLUMA_CG004328, isoform A [Clunio marinus]
MLQNSNHKQTLSFCLLDKAATAATSKSRQQKWKINVLVAAYKMLDGPISITRAKNNNTKVSLFQSGIKPKFERKSMETRICFSFATLIDGSCFECFQRVVNPIAFANFIQTKERKITGRGQHLDCNHFVELLSFTQHCHNLLFNQPHNVTHLLRSHLN